MNVDSLIAFTFQRHLLSYKKNKVSYPENVTRKWNAGMDVDDK